MPTLEELLKDKDPEKLKELLSSISSKKMKSLILFTN